MKKNFGSFKKQFQSSKMAVSLTVLISDEMELSRWDSEGGRLHDCAAYPELRADHRMLTNAELVQLQIRVIALENLAIALLAAAPDHQLAAIRDMAVYISPRSGFTHHHLTVHAARLMIHLADRATVCRDRDID